ncbi:MAG TPA: metal-dependent transcriptional regulator [Acidimicrobiales bacterium]|nr:metal-dependent transcriptional regulator [Acidimicrobiales bacterium]
MQAEISTRSERETLKALYRLSRDPQGPAHTGALAETLGVSHGTATAIVKRLAERGLVDHRLYHGVELTATGNAAAVAAIRRHRIVERFLADMLGYEWKEADRLAASFEHELPQEVEERLYVALDQPSSCPHGFPIPEPRVADIPTMPPLYELETGDVAVVAVPGSTEPEVIQFLETLGLRPGVRIEVVDKQPFDGPIVLRVLLDEGHDTEDRVVGQKVANQIYVRKDPPSSPSSKRKAQTA